MKITRLLVIVVGFILCGCTLQSEQVYVASNTVLGIHGAVNTAQTAGHLVIGYDRKLVAVVPKMATEGKSDAMSALNCTRLKIEGMKLTEFSERLATGDAAEKIAKLKPDASSTATCQHL